MSPTQSAETTRELANLIFRLLAERKLVPDRPYRRSELMNLLKQHRPATVAADFQVIRAWAKSGTCPQGLSTRTSGDRRDIMYCFSPVEQASMLSMDLVESSSGAAASAQQALNHLLHAAQVCPSPTDSNRAPQLRSGAPAKGKVTIYSGDNLPLLRALPDSLVDLIYIDPPFNTGKVQARSQIVTVRDQRGDRIGFQGQRYRTIKVGRKAYGDVFDDYVAFLVPRLKEAYRVLKPDGSLFVHLDYREVHRVKVVLDEIFGRDSFINEIIWAYDYGARSTKKWSPKHDNILWFAKDPKTYCFNFDEIDRIPYMAPGLVGREKAARGKTPTDTWWHTIVSPTGREKTGYPTQKPLGVITRIVKVHSKPGDLLMDFFAGSGTLGEAGAELGRHVILVDNNPEAIAVMARRLARFHPEIRPVTDQLTKRPLARPEVTNITSPEVPLAGRGPC